MTTAPDSTTPAKGGTRRANALPSGHLLDEYRIDAILGAGGFGVTYKALDTHLENWVAIKEYFPIEWSFRDADGVTVRANTQGQTSATEGQASDYEWGLERFLDEARVLARIQHPYVVRIKRYFRGHGTAYIIMDYEEGEPLSAILREGETLAEDQMRGLLEDLLPALQAVHEQGYLHRDIKPSNLYVRAHDHRVMLIDFGAARAAISRHSQSVSSLVTPGYSPPEQYSTRNDRYGPWTDIYALGAVLYRCIAGQTPVEAAERLLDDTLKPAVAVGAGRYSTNLLRVIDRALAVRPEQRFRDVSEIQAGLSGAQDEESDETVIMAPLSKSAKLPTLDRAPLRAALEGTDRNELKRTHPPTASRRSPIQRPSEPPPPLKPRAGAFRWPRWGVLSGGVGLVVALAAIALWRWSSAPVPEVNPSHYSLEQTGQPAETVPAPVAGATPTLQPTTAATLPPVPLIDTTASPPPTAEAPLPMAMPVVVEPTAPLDTIAPALVPALDPEPQTPAASVMQTESEPAAPAVIDERTAQPVQPDSTLDAGLKPAGVSPVETPLVPAIAPTETKPRSSTTTEPATAKQGEGKKPTVPNRNKVESQSRTRRQQSRRDRTQPQPIIVAPTVPDRVTPAQPPRKSPWDSPNSTGFNQK